MRITSKGQITIPQPKQVQFGLPDTEVEFIVPKGKGFIKKMSGKATAGMTTDKIMKLTRAMSLN